MRKQILTELKVPPLKTIQTTRLDVAAYLIVRGFEISHVETGDSAVSFLFENAGGKGEQTMLEFYRGAIVAANKYADAQRRVRDLMWEARRGFARKVV
jgi:hypothetical protein